MNFFENSKSHMDNQEYLVLFRLKESPQVGFYSIIDVPHKMKRYLVDIEILKSITVKGIQKSDFCEVGCFWKRSHRRGILKYL